MSGSLEIPQLYVEGTSDVYSIVHLLERHGIQLDEQKGPVHVNPTGSDTGVVAAVRTAVKATTIPVGFVVDIDLSVSARWKKISDELRDLVVDLPKMMPEEGFIAETQLTKARVGVWLMPDNRTEPGNLETFLQTMVPPTDTLKEHAIASTAKALDLGAPFQQKNLSKAELYCWLSWQEEPNKPFGFAVKQYLRHDSETALKFVQWFRQLYGIPDSVAGHSPQS